MQFSTSSYFLNLAIIQAVILVLAFRASPGARRTLIAIGAVAALFFITPRLIIIYAAFWSCIGLIVSIQTRVAGTSLRRAVLITGVGLCLAPLLVFKIYPFEFWLAWNRDLHLILSYVAPPLTELDRLRPIVTAVGMSFAIFRAIDLLVKTHIGRLQPSFFAVVQYGFFAPVIVAGPIIEFEEIQKPAPVSSTAILTGLICLTTGSFKIAFATFVLRDFADISALDAHTFVWRWIILLVHPWYFYLNFAGYSDMAIGLAALYGFNLKANFNFPFFQTSVQNFWANWHMSLTRWAQRNVFVPLGGYRVRRQYYALVVTMLAIAFWHDVSLGLLLFGLYHSSALVVERQMQQRGLTLPWRGSTAGTLIRMVLTYVFVAVSFPALELPWARLWGVYTSLVGLS